MTEQELAEIESRAEAAAPGPWSVTLDYTRHMISGRRYFPSVTDGAGGFVLPLIVPRYAAAVRKADAEFIAGVRADVPALVAECRRLREALGFYADPATYLAHASLPPSQSSFEDPAIDLDRGGRARAALEGGAHDGPGRARGLLGDIAALCRAAGLSIGHEDSQGAFVVEPYAEASEEWLLDALDRTRPRGAKGGAS